MYKTTSRNYSISCVVFIVARHLLRHALNQLFCVAREKRITFCEIDARVALNCGLTFRFITPTHFQGVSVWGLGRVSLLLWRQFLVLLFLNVTEVCVLSVVAKKGRHSLQARSEKSSTFFVHFIPLIPQHNFFWFFNDWSFKDYCVASWVGLLRSKKQHYKEKNGFCLLTQAVYCITLKYFYMLSFRQTDTNKLIYTYMICQVFKICCFYLQNRKISCSSGNHLEWIRLFSLCRGFQK